MFVRNMVHAPGPADARAATCGPRSAIPAPRQMTRYAGDPSDLTGIYPVLTQHMPRAAILGPRHWAQSPRAAILARRFEPPTAAHGSGCLTGKHSRSYPQRDFRALIVF